MNFYIGNSIQQLNRNEKNIELDDEMIEYLYSIKKLVPYSVFFAIDPYSDIVVEKDDIAELIAMCEYVLNEQVLNDYDESEEIIIAISDLKHLCQNALKAGKKIIVIGD